MPVCQLPPTKERTWPKDLDRLAMLDMKGLLPHKRPEPITPPLAPAKEPAVPPDAPCKQCGALQRRVAKLERAAHDRRRKYNELDGRLRRRDARIAALDDLLKEARADLLAAERRDGKNERIMAELRDAIAERDKEIAALRERVAVFEQEQRESRKVISTVLRAHDILAAKHRRVA